MKQTPEGPMISPLTQAERGDIARMQTLLEEIRHIEEYLKRMGKNRENLTPAEILLLNSLNARVLKFLEEAYKDKLEGDQERTKSN